MKTRIILLLFALLLAAAPLAAQTATPTPTPVQAVITTPVPVSGCDMSLGIRPGIRVNTRPGIYIRNLPTLSGAIVHYIDDSITFRVEDGPVCADGVLWWRVIGPIGYTPGWVAEYEPEGIQLIFPFASDLDPTLLCDEPLNFVSGSHFPLLADVRIRQEPNLSGLVLHVAPTGDTVTIIDGPECQDTLNWWLVQVPYAGIIIQGWMAQGSETRAFLPDPDALPPDQICGPSLPLKIGNRAAIVVHDFKPKNLRVGPGLNEPLLYTLIDGIAIDILEGPVCRSNLNWWRVQIVARPEITGWVSEGGPGNHSIARFTEDHIPSE